jgi:hypothetical protein
MELLALIDCSEWLAMEGDGSPLLAVFLVGLHQFVLVLETAHYALSVDRGTKNS